MTHSGISIDALGEGDISMAVNRDVHGKGDNIVIVGIPKRQARALANRILHEIDHAEGKRSRRPSSPHLFFVDLQPCMDCGRKNASACNGRGGRPCPLAQTPSPQPKGTETMKRSDTVIVYGPPACGKTRNADRILEMTACTHIIDDWRSVRGADQPITLGALHLTQQHPGEILGVTVIAYDELGLEEEKPAHPAGEYAIAEIMGHRTLIGRVTEVERFGAKLMAIEPIFRGDLLAPVLIGGSSIYQFTPCTAETAFQRAAKEIWQLPTSIRATVPAPMLPSPSAADEEELPF